MKTIKHNGFIYSYKKSDDVGSCKGCIFHADADYKYRLEECKSAPNCGRIIFTKIEKESEKI